MLSSPHHPLVSIITVVYNGKSYLERTIESVLSQNYPNLEYIIVDGNSNDGTIELIKTFGDRIRWISEPDKGIYDAMNKGISMASGVWVNFLNGGDYFFDSNVVSTVFVQKKNQDIDFIYGDSINKADNFTRYIEARKISLATLHSGLGVCHQSMFVRKAIIPNYDLQYRFKAEYNWVIDIFEKIPQDHIQHVEIPVVYYALGGFSEKGLLKNIQEFISVTMTRFGWRQVIKNIPIYTLLFLRFLKYKFIGYV